MKQVSWILLGNVLLVELFYQFLRVLMPDRHRGLSMVGSAI